ncbi:fatty acid desaturase [Limibacillus halophilus]|uniref:Fatty acid desaturase n=1 Tax=Limibacillus halophilus TaxID=1579333 RepID=A0A839SSF0_9PROT|nr:fatty acid desaturase [Limibacillus halophilus]MBB3064909.1 fatty acid desaturase [Limibacillus halophilus]
MGTAPVSQAATPSNRSNPASQAHEALAAQARRIRPIEIPTLVVAVAIYCGFALVTYHHAALPNWLLLILGGYLVAWHGSLQHEVIHGHPTPWNWLNEIIVFPSLWLVIPFDSYRESHLAHHRDENLTDPALDPESFYVTAREWRRAGPLGRAFLTLHNCLLGRLILGPLWILLLQSRAIFKAIISGDLKALFGWAKHGLAICLVLVWVLEVSGLPLWKYLLFFVYPGLALTLLRSFAEHRAVPSVSARTAIQQAEWPFALLFLNNNLHALHHLQPGLAWYRLPAVWRALRPDLNAASGRESGELFRGYWEIVLRYLLWPKEPPLHPAERWRLAGKPDDISGSMLQNPGEA